MYTVCHLLEIILILLHCTGLKTQQFAYYFFFLLTEILKSRITSTHTFFYIQNIEIRLAAFKFIYSRIERIIVCLLETQD